MLVQHAQCSLRAGCISGPPLQVRVPSERPGQRGEAVLSSGGAEARHDPGAPGQGSACTLGGALCSRRCRLTWRCSCAAGGAAPCCAVRAAAVPSDPSCPLPPASLVLQGEWLYMIEVGRCSAAAAPAPVCRRWRRRSGTAACMQRRPRGTQGREPSLPGCPPAAAPPAPLHLQSDYVFMKPLPLPTAESQVGGARRRSLFLRVAATPQRAPALCVNSKVTRANCPSCLWLLPQARYQAWGFPFDYIKPALFPAEMAKLYSGPLADIPGTGPAPLLMRAAAWKRVRCSGGGRRGCLRCVHERRAL